MESENKGPEIFNRKMRSVNSFLSKYIRNSYQIDHPLCNQNILIISYY